MDDDQATQPAADAAPVVDVAPPVTLPSEAYDLDLDLIQPQTKKVKLGESIYDVTPPRVKDIADLARLAGSLQNRSGDVENNVADMIKVFKRLMPALNNDDVDLSLPQVMALFQFITQMASPVENSALKALGVEPTQEKKAPVEPSEPTPTS